MLVGRWEVSLYIHRLCRCYKGYRSTQSYRVLPIKAMYPPPFCVTPYTIHSAAKHIHITFLSIASLLIPQYVHLHVRNYSIVKRVHYSISTLFSDYYSLITVHHYSTERGIVCNSVVIGIFVTTYHMRTM